jgi:hypothetical protein
MKIKMNSLDNPDLHRIDQNCEAIAPFRKNITLCSKFEFDIQNNKRTGNFNSDPKYIRQIFETI